MSRVETVPLEYADYVERLRAAEPTLAGEFAGLTGIEHILQWMQRHGMCEQRQVIDLVGQDEFSNDFLLQLEPEGRWLVCGVT
jgi:hypothetical protein